MQGARKFALWVLIIAIILFGGYFVYQKWWGEQDSTSAFGKIKGIALDKISSAGVFLKDKTSNTFEKAAKSTYSYAKRTSGDAIVSLGNGIESFGQSLGASSTEREASSNSSVSSLPTISSTVSVSPTSTGFFVPPPIFAISGRPNEPLVFSLSRTGTFSILWGDESAENVSVEENQTKTVSHTWKREGDFEMSIVFVGNGNREEWKLFVRIH